LIATGPGGADRRIRIWSVSSGEAILSLTGQRGNVRGLAWSPDSRLLASGGADLLVRIWDIEQGSLVGEPMPGHQGEISSVSFSSDGRILASGSADRSVIVWDVQSRTQVARLEKHIRAVTGVNFSPQKGTNLLATSSIDNSVELYEIVPQLPLVEQLPALRTQGRILAAAVTASGPRFVAASENRLEIWDLSARINEFPMRRAVSAALSGDGRVLAAVDENGDIKIIQVDSGKESTATGNLPAKYQAVALNADGSRLAASYCTLVETIAAKEVCSQPALTVWDLTLGTQASPPFDAGNDAIRSLAFHPTLPLLALGNQDATIRFWNLESLGPSISQPLPMVGHTASVTSLAFSRDGKTLASGSANQELVLWDVETQQSIGEPLSSEAAATSALAFTTDGAELFAGGSAGQLQRWAVGFEQWSERICTLAGRNLTRQEWEQFFPDQTYRKTCPGYPEGQ
jgi:WD40 repeat protein